MPTRSLLEMSQERAVDLLRGSGFTGEDYEALEPRQVRLMFEHIKPKLLDLQHIEAAMTDFCPTLDAKIILNAARTATIPTHGHRSCDIAHRPNGHCTKKMLLNKWENMANTASEANTVSDPATKWNQHQIYAAGPDFDFQICRHTGPHSDFACPCLAETGQPLATRISAPLLYYRATATFGMPSSTLPAPRHWHPDHWRWKQALVFKDDGSRLLLHDWKEHAAVDFRGTFEASASALEVLNFLVRYECSDGSLDVGAGGQLGISAASRVMG